MRIRALAAVTTAATVFSVALSGIGTASAAGSTARARYLALAGDSRYLVYAEAVQAAALDPVSLVSHANLFALGPRGKPISLGKAGAEGRNELVSLSQASVIVETKLKTGDRIRWWNLDSGKSGDISTSEKVLGATPDGWLTEEGGFTDGKHVVSRSYAGDLVDYGNPLKNGVGFGVTVGPNGFVAYADNFRNDNGEITYTPWAHPTVHRILAAPGGKNVRCDFVSATHAACVLGDGATRAVALFGLGGGHRTTAGSRCAYEVTAWGSRLVWSVISSNHGCKAGHLGLMTDVGTTRQSKERVSPLAITTVWGKLVASSLGQRGLVTLRSIRGAARPLNRANVS